MKSRRTFLVEEVATIVSVSVRALHHYEQIPEFDQRKALTDRSQPLMLRRMHGKLWRQVTALTIALVPACVAPPRAVEPRPGADCPSATEEGPFRAGELLVAYGATPHTSFQTTGLMIAVDGQVAFNRQDLGPDERVPRVVFRRSVHGGGHSVVLIASLVGRDELAGYKFKVPYGHSIELDGKGATCVDLHLGFKDDMSDSPFNRPVLLGTDVPLAVTGE